MTPVEKLELSNGIPVLIADLPGYVATTYWWNQVGSADEATREAGYSHFLEHMLFKDAGAKDSGQASTGKMARAIESLGGEVNAYTSFEQTVYHFTCAEQHWERALDVFGKMAKPERFLKLDFEREREVILEEIKKNEDSPDRQVTQAIFSSTFKRHPYGKPVIGTVKNLKRATVQDLDRYYRNHYVPENMGLIVVGPLGEKGSARRKAIVRKLEKYWGKTVLKPRKRPVLRRSSESSSERETRVQIKEFDVKTPTLAFAFKIPELDHKDIPALDLLSGIMGMGELSRLYQKLFYERRLVTDVSCGLYVPKDNGIFYVYSDHTEVEQTIPLAEAIFEEIKELKTKGPQDDEIKRVIAAEESDRLFATQTVDGLASRLGFLQFVVGDLEYDRGYLDRLRMVDREELIRVSNQYLVAENLSVVSMRPMQSEKDHENELKLLAKRWVGKSKPTSNRSKSKTTSMFEPQKWTSDSGLRVTYFPRRQSPSFSVHASCLGGVRLEEPKQAGMSHVFAMTWTKGTESKQPNQITKLIEERAADLDGFSGRNTLGLEMSGLVRDWDVLKDLYVDVLGHSKPSEEELNHSKRVTEDYIRSLEDRSAQLCIRMFLETLYEEHAYRRSLYGSLESIRNLSLDSVSDQYRKWVQSQRLVLSVVGNVNESKVHDLVKEVESVLSDRSDSARAQAQITVSDENALNGPRWVERHLGREQVHIFKGGLGCRMSDSDRFAIRLMNTILGGQSGRMFLELREKRSLAYSVSPISFEGLERGYIGTYIACAGSKQEEAISGIEQVLEKLASKGPSEVEMKRAKEYYLGRRAMELQSDLSLASHFGLVNLYQVGSVSEDDFVKRIRKVSAKDIQRVCRKYLMEPHLVTSIVG